MTGEQIVQGNSLLDIQIAGQMTRVEEALAIIDRQKEEIERLTVELDAMRGAANSYKMHYENARAETAMRIFADIDEKSLYLKSITLRGEEVEWDVLPAVLIRCSDFDELNNKYIKDLRTMTPEEKERHYLGKWVKGEDHETTDP